MSIRRSVWLGGLLSLFALSSMLASPAQSQIAGGGTIVIVVPIGAGGGVDATGRLIAEKLAARLKQNVVVENRVGAGGAVGINSVAKAEPDGHTLLLMESSSVLHKWLHANVQFDVVKDFVPIAQVATAPLLLFAQASFQAEQCEGPDRAGQGQSGQVFGWHAWRRHPASPCLR